MRKRLAAPPGQPWWCGAGQRPHSSGSRHQSCPPGGCAWRTRSPWCGQSAPQQEDRKIAGLHATWQGHRKHCKAVSYSAIKHLRHQGTSAKHMHWLGSLVNLLHFARGEPLLHSHYTAPLSYSITSFPKDQHKAFTHFLNSVW